MILAPSFSPPSLISLILKLKLRRYLFEIMRITEKFVSFVNGLVNVLNLREAVRHHSPVFDGVVKYVENVS